MRLKTFLLPNTLAEDWDPVDISWWHLKQRILLPGQRLRLDWQEWCG